MCICTIMNGYILFIYFLLPFNLTGFPFIALCCTELRTPNGCSPCRTKKKNVHPSDQMSLLYDPCNEEQTAIHDLQIFGREPVKGSLDSTREGMRTEFRYIFTATEICQFEADATLLIGYQNVGWFDVSMHQHFGMKVMQAFSHLQQGV